MTPAVPLPLVVPMTSTSEPASKRAAVSSWPSVNSEAFGVRISATCRRGVTPAFSKWPFSGLVTVRGSIWPCACCTAAEPSASAERTWVTTFGPTATTVTGTRRPLSSHTWVMPSFVPMRAVTARSFCWVTIEISSFPASELDLAVHVRRQVETHERVDGLRRGIDDVDEPLVRAHLEVLAAVLVLVGRPDDAEHVLLRRQRHRTHDRRTSASHRVDDLARRAVDDFVVVGLEPDADLLSRHGASTSLCLEPA